MSPRVRTRFLSVVTAAFLIGLIALPASGPALAGGDATTVTGGVLRIGMVGDVSAQFDPQKEYYGVAWEFFRGALLRTLLSYDAVETYAEDTSPKPDLAASMPTQSADRLTWTFHLKSGIHYGPPLQDLTVQAADVIRAIERLACAKCSAGGYAFYYSTIAGFDEFAAGTTSAISGLTAPDPLTLRVTTVTADGTIPYLFSMPATAPIPPNPDRPTDRLGIAAGHAAGFGRFLVATGPYMFAGSEDLDFSKPASDQAPVAGYVPGSSIRLVRNPSWSASTDALRTAAVDGIRAFIGLGVDRIAARIDAGTIDFGLDNYSSQQVDRYLADPALADRVHSIEGNSTTYLNMNVAQPPFDSVNVRRAVNWVVNKHRMLAATASTIVGGEIATHVLPPGTGGAALGDYDPYATTDGRGSVRQARAEMKLSRYDRNGDGVCDARACSSVLTIVHGRDATQRAYIRTVADRLGKIGITLDVRAVGGPSDWFGPYDVCADPTSHVGLCAMWYFGWGADFPDASTFMVLFKGSSIANGLNWTFVGATPQQLRSWGYKASSVPSVDDRIAACEALAGDVRTTCWADLDRYLMEEVVPWAPYAWMNTVHVMSARVAECPFDPSTALTALDHVTLTT